MALSIMKKKIFFVYMFCMFLMHNASWAKVLYVDLLSLGNNSGTSWQHAFLSLDSALHEATSGDSIFVAQGIYYPSSYPWTDTTGLSSRDFTFYLKDGIALFGGFPNGGGTRDWKNNICILSGDIGNLLDNTDNCYHVVLISNSNSGGTVLNGFTIKNGNANANNNSATIINANSIYRNEGGGIFMAKGLNQIQNCIFENNFAQSKGGAIASHLGILEMVNSELRHNNAEYGGAVYTSFCNTDLHSNILDSNAANFGGGLYLSANKHVLKENKIANHSALSKGGALWIEADSLEMIANILHHNKSNDLGGALFMQYTNALINANFVYDNTALTGGGFFLGSNHEYLFNNIFSNNIADAGGALYADCFNGSDTIVNNTFYGNNANDIGGAMYTKYNGPSYGEMYIANCIFWNNKKNNSNAVPDADVYNNGTALPFVHCITQTNSNYSTGIGILNNKNPQFINPQDINGADDIFGNADDGFQLTQNSYAINNGNNVSLPNNLTNDIINNSRIQNNICDIGAYESGYWGLNNKENLLNTNAFLLYPNPAQNWLHIKFQKVPSAIVQYKIFDMQGKMLQYEIKNIENARIQIATENLVKGVYILQLSSDAFSTQEFQFVK